MARSALTVLIAIMLAQMQVQAAPADGNSSPNAATAYKAIFATIPVQSASGKDWISNEDYKKLIAGEINVSPEAAAYVTKNSDIIKQLLKASAIEACDWKLKLSDGISLDMSHLKSAREAAKLVIVDAFIKAQNHQYRKGLEDCISNYRMSYHVGRDGLVSYMVGVAIREISAKCMVHILDEMPADSNTLTWLDGEFSHLESIRPTLPQCLDVEIRSMARADSKTLGVQIKSAKDEAALKKAIIYYRTYINKIKFAIAMPYDEAYNKLNQLRSQFHSEVEPLNLGSLEATDYGPILSYNVRERTFFNALRTAATIRLAGASAATKAAFNVDVFSRKPFLYEKQDGGFVLRCQGLDMTKNIIPEFQFRTTE
jgi:hypothetical protein